MAVSAVFVFVIVFIDQIDPPQQIDIVKQLAGMQIRGDRVSLVKQDRAVGDLLYEFEVVCGSDQCLPGMVQFGQKLDQPSFRPRIKAVHRFVKHEDLRIQRQYAGDRDLALFTSAQMIRLSVPKVL